MIRNGGDEEVEVMYKCEPNKSTEHPRRHISCRWTSKEDNGRDEKKKAHAHIHNIRQLVYICECVLSAYACIHEYVWGMGHLWVYLGGRGYDLDNGLRIETVERHNKS